MRATMGIAINEMISVHSFTSNLKKNPKFMKKFIELEVGSIQTRTVDKTDVADFLITLKLEGSMEEDEGEEDGK